MPLFSPPSPPARVFAATACRFRHFFFTHYFAADTPFAFTRYADFRRILLTPRCRRDRYA